MDSLRNGGKDLISRLPLLGVCVLRAGTGLTALLTAALQHVVELFMLCCKVFLASELSLQATLPRGNLVNPSPLLAISFVKLLLSLVHCVLHYRAFGPGVLSRAPGQRNTLMDNKSEESPFTCGRLSPHPTWTSGVRCAGQMISTAIVAACIRWVFIRIVRCSFICYNQLSQCCGSGYSSSNFCDHERPCSSRSLRNRDNLHT
jgi:hypothetical protein